MRWAYILTRSPSSCHAKKRLSAERLGIFGAWSDKLPDLEIAASTVHLLT
jgi:hypothetical protein